MWRQVAAVMGETRDLGVEWPHWQTLIFDGEVRTDMRYVCPKDATGQVSPLDDVGSKARVRRIEGGCFGLNHLLLFCEEGQRRSGPTSTATSQENYFWKAAGCRNDGYLAGARSGFAAKKDEGRLE